MNARTPFDSSQVSSLVPPLPDHETLPKLSRKMRAVLKRLSDSASADAVATLEVLRSSIPEYGAIQDPAIRRDVLEMIEHNTVIASRAILSGKAPGERELRLTEGMVRRRVHQELPLPSVLQAFRLGFRVHWNRLLQQTGEDEALRKELLFTLSPYLLYQQDQTALMLTQVYSDEQQRRSHWRDRARHELCSILYNHPEDEDGFRQRALALGLDASTPHIALALRTGGRGNGIDEQQNWQDAVLKAAAALLGTKARTLLSTQRPGHLLLWCPLPVGEHALSYEQVLTRQAQALQKATAGIRAIGIGLPDTGPAGWRSSGEQALQAVEIGGRLSPDQSVYCYSDIALEHCVMDSPALKRLLHHRLERLSAEPNLLETLQAWCEHGPHRKVVAGILGIHPNSVDYRLDRIEQLLGERLSDLHKLSRLHLALRMRQLTQAGGGAPRTLSTRSSRS
ncbi:MAG: helix-turn-helix domain-containing protein [Stagnimonas sp.]|nr:helix-turn-helix domain-containing protein [Stagnimonas sp.]